MTDQGLCDHTAVELAARLHSGEVSAREVLAAHLARIEAVNPELNAIVTLVPEAAEAAAAAADERHAAGEPLGLLHGLPIAHKDLVPTKGVRTTMGSTLLADWVPNANAALADRYAAAGAIMIGKTNTPEFGFGSQTFNEVFGITRNPWDPSRTPGGSSGGASVALTTGMLPIADGSDMGGSLRNPAGWTNIVGLRPSPGLVPSAPSTAAFIRLGVLGAMGRTTADVALQLAALAGPDPRAPLSFPVDAAAFAEPLHAEPAGVRIAFSPTLGDLPVDAAVLEVLANARSAFVDLGCDVRDVDPDFSGADEAGRTLRAHSLNISTGELAAPHLDRVKETVRWQIELARSLTPADLVSAENVRSAVFARMADFFDSYDFLVTATAQVPPFPVEVEYPTEINGQQLDSYVTWMNCCSRITLTDRPSISIPAGFTDDGLPIGMQIVGAHHGDLDLLRFAHVVEQSMGLTSRRPPTPTTSR